MPELNLLNPEERNKAKKIKIYFIVKHVLLQILSILLIIITIFYFSTIIIQNNLSLTNSQIDQEIQIRQEGNLNSIEDATKQLNSQLELVTQIQQKYFVWTSFIDDFSDVIPNGIILTKIEFHTNFLTDSLVKTFRIEGDALTRDDFLKLEENLTNSMLFANVNAPISNIIQKENINFTITGNLSDEIFL